METTVTDCNFFFYFAMEFGEGMNVTVAIRSAGHQDTLLPGVVL